MSLADLEDKIKKTQAELWKEEKMIQGFTNMSKVAKGAQRLQAQSQLEGSQKQVRRINLFLFSNTLIALPPGYSLARDHRVHATCRRCQEKESRGRQGHSGFFSFLFFFYFSF